MTKTGRGPRGDVRAYLLGAGGLLAVEAVVAGILLLPPTVAVAGSAAPAPAAADSGPAPAAPSASPTATRPPADRPADAPGKAAPEPSRAPDPTRDTGDTGNDRDTGDTGDTAPAGQRPGTIRLPGGGTAGLVREEVGADAVLPVPENLGEATWWGAGLGAPSGASVFAGHVDWNGRTGPFAELWRIEIGERVTVRDDAGRAWHYAVSRIVTLGKNELPARADELFGQAGPHRIVLVTCGGRWLGGTTGYAENRVVIAEPM
ncbi:sortase family protein [Prauserella shujinwangii]|uniref:Sortase family protein n=1 Tax=Prauserella shujinwangii TaxID=1453103 RepID=A0A2T0M017_9PSEU|nr:class F sortase [Prauserella shujinwangii]PRX49917.1 sortase family protein [Prauserella shujinwangii]